VISIARHKLADHYQKLAREERRHLKLVSSRVTEARNQDPWSAAENREDIARAR